MREKQKKNWCYSVTYWKIKERFLITNALNAASPVAQRLKHLPGLQETPVRSLGREDPLAKEMATHSSTLAWRIPWREEPGRLLVHGVAKSRTRLSDFTHSLTQPIESLDLSSRAAIYGVTKEGNGNPLQCSCLENPRDGRAWWTAVYGVAQSRTRLK